MSHDLMFAIVKRIVNYKEQTPSNKQVYEFIRSKDKSRLINPMT